MPVQTARSRPGPSPRPRPRQDQRLERCQRSRPKQASCGKAQASYRRGLDALLQVQTTGRKPPTRMPQMSIGEALAHSQTLDSRQEDPDSEKLPSRARIACGPERGAASRGGGHAIRHALLELQLLRSTLQPRWGEPAPRCGRVAYRDLQSAETFGQGSPRLLM